MASRCAICERPIVRTQKFVIADTEAVHTECARRGGMTVAQRLRRELEDTRAQLAAERRQVTEVEIATRSAEATARAERYRADQAERQRDAHRRDLVRTRQQLSEATANADAARRDLALQTALAAGSPPAAPVTAPAVPLEQPPARDDRDGTVIRMSLLELK